MAHRYDTETERRRGRDWQRDEHRQPESESGWRGGSEWRGGREGRRYGEEDYPSREEFGSRDYDRENERRRQNRYEYQGSEWSPRESGRYRDDYGNWDERSSYSPSWGGSSSPRQGGFGPEFERREYPPTRGSYGGSYDRNEPSRGTTYQSESLFGVIGSYPLGSRNRQGSEQQGGRGQYVGRGPKGYRRSDERIEEDVNEALSQHGEVDASEIEVKVHNGEVTLSGTVPERNMKRMAEDIAEQCSGVHDVHNEIRVHREEGQEGQSHQQMRGKTASGTGSKTQESKTA